MIAKGTADYKKAQEIANAISAAAMTTKINSAAFDWDFNKLGKFVFKMAKLNVFAAKIAETVDKTMNPYNYTVAKVSDKQSWILACAAVENNIEF